MCSDSHSSIKTKPPKGRPFIGSTFLIYMNELANEQKRPLDRSNMGNDVAALNNLVGFLNNPNVTGARVPVNEPAPIPVPVSEPQPEAIPTKEVPTVGKRVFLTGRLAIGKDYVAEQIGAPVFGFADPIYSIAQYGFGVEVTSSKNKDLPGMRQFLQQAGQWGRADVDEAYPYTPARMAFCIMIRALGAQGAIDPDGKLCVDWKNFGLDPLIWSNALVNRVNVFLNATPGSRVTNTNVRFKHEYGALKDAGWEHYHVMASPATWAGRLKTKGLTSESSQLKDKSEHLATFLDQEVTKTISREPRGKMLRVVWNDATPPPSPRIMTLSQFCERIAVSDGVLVNTGE